MVRWVRSKRQGLGLILHLCGALWLGPGLALAQEEPPAPPPPPAPPSPPLAQPLSDAAWAELEAYIDDARVAFDVPGASVAIITDGRVARVGAFGVRGVGSAEPVDEDTRFMIGSITKSMTTTLAATLVHEGKFGWDDELVEHLPEFRVSNPAWTPLVRLRDAFGHTSGVPRADFHLFVQQPGPLGLLDTVASVVATAPPGERYEYQNQVFALGGFAALAAAGVPRRDGALASAYERLMRRRVFRPLHMRRTLIDFDAAVGDENHAWPSGYDALTASLAPVAIGFERFATSVAPAGAVWSTAGDMARYLAMHLREGAAEDGSELFPRAELLETHAAHASMGGSASYGLGWVVIENALGTVLAHGGGTAGFNADVLSIPAQGWGAVILTNRNGAGPFIQGVERRIVASLYGVTPSNDDDLYAAAAELEAAYASLLAVLEPVSAEVVAGLAGCYEQGVDVEAAGDELALTTVYGPHRFRALSGVPNVFVGVDNVLAGAPLVATTDSAGRVTLVLGSLGNGEEPAPPVIRLARLDDCGLSPPSSPQRAGAVAASEPRRLPFGLPPVQSSTQALLQRLDALERLRLEPPGLH